MLAGLTQRVAFLSFEFTREFVDHAQACLERLAELGYRGFNLSLGESAELLFDDWTDGDAVISAIGDLGPDGWGDVYTQG